MYLFLVYVGQPAVRCRGAGRLRHRHANRAGGVPAGRGAGIRGGAGGGSELRRAARRPRPRDVHVGRVAGRRADAALRRCSATSRRLRWSDSSRTIRTVVAVGDEYLRIISWNFVASGIIFVGSSMFQAIGNTIPPLITSFLRLVLVAVPVLCCPGTPLHPAMDLVSLGGVGHAADGAEPAPAEARVQPPTPLRPDAVNRPSSLGQRLSHARRRSMRAGRPDRGRHASPRRRR